VWAAGTLLLVVPGCLVAVAAPSAAPTWAVRVDSLSICLHTVRFESLDSLFICLHSALFEILPSKTFKKNASFAQEKVQNCNIMILVNFALGKTTTEIYICSKFIFDLLP
jgi:hypothetical protein